VANTLTTHPNGAVGCIASLGRVDRIYVLVTSSACLGAGPFVVEAYGALYGRVVTFPNGLNVAEPV
jgi:hypothetical protein